MRVFTILILLLAFSFAGVIYKTKERLPKGVAYFEEAKFFTLPIGDINDGWMSEPGPNMELAPKFKPGVSTGKVIGEFVVPEGDKKLVPGAYYIAQVEGFGFMFVQKDKAQQYLEKEVAIKTLLKYTGDFQQNKARAENLIQNIFGNQVVKDTGGLDQYSVSNGFIYFAGRGRKIKSQNLEKLIAELGNNKAFKRILGLGTEEYVPMLSKKTDQIYDTSYTRYALIKVGFLGLDNTANYLYFFDDEEKR
ncbi:MAG: hypothetical protein JNJ47_07265 [Alphaproteobacteria bacterium]|nr:hypothetical protein [Alphaproteobacteria bacterium]